MIRETTYHATKEAAESFGKGFQMGWGWAYGPTFCTYYEKESDSWACLTYRYASCD